MRYMRARYYFAVNARSLIFLEAGTTCFVVQCNVGVMASSISELFDRISRAVSGYTDEDYFIYNYVT
jgi:hypothetical protein